MADAESQNTNNSLSVLSVAVDPAYQFHEPARYPRDSNVGSIGTEYSGASREDVTLAESNDFEKCLDFDSLHTTFEETSNIVRKIPYPAAKKHNETVSQAAAHQVFNNQTPEYPGTLTLSLLTIGICLSVFLVSLDRTIIAQVRKQGDGNVVTKQR